jgi:hypothetical protein
MGSTTEERAKRRQERVDEKSRNAERFPEFFYARYPLQIILKEGEYSFLRVRTNNLDQFTPSVIGGDEGWVEAAVPIDNINVLAHFIAALAARLNALIESANESMLRAQPLILNRLEHAPLLAENPDGTDTSPNVLAPQASTKRRKLK